MIRSEQSASAYVEIFVTETPSGLQTWENVTQKVIYVLAFTTLFPIRCHFPCLYHKVVITLYFSLVCDEIYSVLIEVIHEGHLGGSVH